MNNNFEFLEKIVLSILIVCTVIAIGMEIQAMILNLKVTLADILLLFLRILIGTGRCSEEYQAEP